MVVDDDRDLLGIIGKMLEASGYNFHDFDDPRKALHHIKHECMECNVVISDIRMPAMSCFELVMSLKDLRPKMKVILMTAFNTTKEEVQLVLPSVKVDAFLNKPFGSKDLTEALGSCTVERQ